MNRSRFGIMSTIALIGSALGFSGRAHNVGVAVVVIDDKPLPPELAPMPRRQNKSRGPRRGGCSGGRGIGNRAAEGRELNDVRAALFNYAGWSGHDRELLAARYLELGGQPGETLLSKRTGRFFAV